MQAMEIVEPGTLTADPIAAAAIAATCHRQGVVVLTCGTWGTSSVLPPLRIAASALEEGLDVLAAAVTSVLG